jgi:hypothetical protein
MSLLTNEEKELNLIIIEFDNMLIKSSMCDIFIESGILKRIIFNDYFFFKYNINVVLNKKNKKEEDNYNKIKKLLNFILDNNTIIITYNHCRYICKFKYIENKDVFGLSIIFDILQKE